MNALKRARQVAGISANDLANDIGVTPITVYRWESGKFPVSYHKALLLVGRLGTYGLKIEHFGYEFKENK